MVMSKDDWALARAKQILIEADPRLSDYQGRGRVAAWIINAFARYIAEHEEPPVDPIEQLFADTFGPEIGQIGGWDRYHKQFRKLAAERGINFNVQERP
jgi:hypothetical protein